MVCTSPRTLIADDQPDVIEALRLLLKREGFEIEAANSPRAVLERLESHDYDLLLMDLNYARDTTSGQEGLDLLARIRRLDSALPVVVMTAWGSVPLAVEAMRRGAQDFVQKPWDNSQLLSTLRHQIEAGATARAHGREEMEEAVAIQHALLPRHIPKLPGVDLAVAWNPADQMSGDYLDLIRLGERRLAIGVGDVVGKGLPAAMLMSNLQAAVRTLAPDVTAPERLIARVNRLVSANTTTQKFITLFYGVLDGYRLTYTNAGHNAPLVVRSSGECVRLDSGGVVLGVFPDWSYRQASVDLAPGDRLLLFSDGVTEAENAAGQEFGEDRLLDLVRRNRHLDAARLRSKVMAAVADFAGGPLQDDATLVVVAVSGQ
jgi:sigma-B regulation protein RsbU (phosphoserine phosphatase)